MSKHLQNMPLPSIPQTLPPLPTSSPPINPNFSTLPRNMPAPNNPIENSPVTTTIMVQTKFGKYPITMNCPFCKAVIVTRVKKMHPCLNFFCCFCCCCGMSCKRKAHLCHNCKSYLGSCDM